MFSIYVPRLLNEHTVQSVSNIMNHFRLGVVHHVDFTPINKKPGFYETFDAKYKSAFIHFVDVLPLYQINIDLWRQIQIEDNDKGKGYKLYISQCEYWICLKNHSPIQRTMMNIHQVVENGRYLEDRVKTLEDNNKQLQDKLAKLELIMAPMLEPPKLQRHTNYTQDYTPNYNTYTEDPDTWNTNTHTNTYTEDKDEDEEYNIFTKQQIQNMTYDSALDRY